MNKNIWTFAAALFFCLMVITRTTYTQTAVTIADLGNLNTRASKLVQPQAPENAGNKGLGNYVNVKVTVNENGGVIKAEAASGDDLFQPAAVLAAVQTQFAPYLVKGRAVKFSGTLSFHFQDAVTEALQNQTINFNNLIKTDLKALAEELDAKKVVVGTNSKYDQAVAEIDKLLAAFDEKNELMKKAILNKRSETQMDNLTNCQTENEMTGILEKMKRIFEQMQKDKLATYDKGLAGYETRQRDIVKIIAAYRCVLV